MNSKTSYNINEERFLKRMDEMSGIGAVDSGGVHRLSLTDEDKEARDLLTKWMEVAGLEVDVDEIGNMYGSRAGKNQIPPVAFGSHLDTVGSGGKFDGSLGVLAALEVMESINDQDLETPAPLCMVNFTNEEGARFAPDMMGSMVVAGQQTLKQVWESRDLHDNTIILKDELNRIGYKGEMDPVSFRPSGFLELHIEQGPVLENEGITIGAVDSVQGIHWIEFLIRGQSNHAGTTPMELRKDAGLVAYRLASFCRRITAEYPDLRATAGLMEVKPNLINVIPGEARMTVDFRCPDKKVLGSVEQELLDFAVEAASAENCSLENKILTAVDPVQFEEKLVREIECCAASLGYSVKRMISGAGHDAQLLAGIVPAAMIFIQSKNGISHSVDEYSNPEDCVAGANVLLNAVISIAGYI